MSSAAVSFSRKDRDILSLVRTLGVAPKEIAGELELSVTTINDRINAMCQRTRVTRAQLGMWVVRNPDCLIAGTRCVPGFVPAIP